MCASVWCVPVCGVCLCVYDVGLCMFAAECVLCYLPVGQLRMHQLSGRLCVVIALHACVPECYGVACVWCVPLCGVCLCVYDVGLCMFAAECVLCYLPVGQLRMHQLSGRLCVVIALHACFRL